MLSREDIANLESLPGSDFTIADEEKKGREQEQEELRAIPVSMCS